MSVTDLGAACERVVGWLQWRVLKAARGDEEEAGHAEWRLVQEAAPSYEHFFVLRYRGWNVEPYPFAWVHLPTTELDYAAMLTRISREYDRRFRNGGDSA